eukprot:3453836-Rhodomonas_salina.1
MKLNRCCCCCRRPGECHFPDERVITACHKSTPLPSCLSASSEASIPVGSIGGRECVVMEKDDSEESGWGADNVVVDAAVGAGVGERGGGGGGGLGRGHAEGVLADGRHQHLHLPPAPPLFPLTLIPHSLHPSHQSKRRTRFF